MSFIRPELASKLHPWREVIAAGLCVLFGAWVFTRGGLLFQPLGLIIAALGIVWAITARRQMRFQRAIGAPGLVEIDEGAVRYFAPRALGGEIPLRDLSEIRFLRLSGRAHWRLKTLDGQALLIPIEAAGAGKLADAFTSLPGVDMRRITAALLPEAPAIQTVWTRPTPRTLT